MIWKIFFIVYILALMLFGICNEPSSNIEALNIYSIADVGLCFMFMTIFGVFYSLGFKKRLFSKKILNISLFLFIISFILFFVALEIYGIHIPVYDVGNKAENITIFTIVTIFLALIANVLFIPFYIGLYKYQKHFDTLEEQKKPYWKVFAIYSIVSLSTGFISYILTYSDFLKYNFFDFFIIFSCIYEILYITGFAWNIKFFNKLFWQITFVPYVILTFISPFFVSETFEQNFHILENLKNPIASTVIYIILAIIFIYTLYQYAFKKEEASNEIQA